MVGMTIHNQVNQSDKSIGISFRRKDQLPGEVIWSVFEKLSRSNSRFNALGNLVVNMHMLRHQWELAASLLRQWEDRSPSWHTLKNYKN